MSNPEKLTTTEDALKAAEAALQSAEQRFKTAETRGALAVKEGKLIQALRAFVGSLVTHAVNLQEFGDAISGSVMKLVDSECGPSAESEAQLRDRQIAVINALEPTIDILRDATKCPLAAPAKTLLLGQYDNYRQICSTECGIKLGQIR